MASLTIERIINRMRVSYDYDDEEIVRRYDQLMRLARLSRPLTICGRTLPVGSGMLLNLFPQLTSALRTNNPPKEILT